MDWIKLNSTAFIRKCRIVFCCIPLFVVNTGQVFVPEYSRWWPEYKGGVLQDKNKLFCSFVSLQFIPSLLALTSVTHHRVVTIPGWGVKTGGTDWRGGWRDLIKMLSMQISVTENTVVEWRPRRTDASTEIFRSQKVQNSIVPYFSDHTFINLEISEQGLGRNRKLPQCTGWKVNL